MSGDGVEVGQALGLELVQEAECTLDRRLLPEKRVAADHNDLEIGSQQQDVGGLKPAIHTVLLNQA